MDDSNEISLTEKQRYWLEHLQACEISGKGIAAYAADQGLDAHTLYAGKQVLIKKGALPRTGPRRFQRVQVSDSVMDNTWRIQLPNGVSVAFAGVVDMRTLSAVLTTAAAVD